MTIVHSDVSLWFLAFMLSSHTVSAQIPTPSPGRPASEQAVLGSARPLSVDEAVRLALEHNLNIQVERLSPQMADLSMASARSAWAPVLTSTMTGASAKNPAYSFLSGSQSSVSDRQFFSAAGVTQLLRWGGSYAISWDGSRSTTTNLFSNFYPIVRSNLSFRYIQPLLRNFSIDSGRQRWLLSKKDREITDVQFRQTVVTTVRNVRHAYWDLAYAMALLGVQRQSFDLAQTSLRNTRSRVEQGSVAPIEMVEAEAEVAQRSEAVVVAEASVSQAQDRLRSLILDPATPDFWNLTFEPTNITSAEVQPIDLDAAEWVALDKRADIQRAKKTLENSEVGIRYVRNQTLPDVDLHVDYGITGVGGTQFIRGQGFPGEIVGRTQRGFGSVLGNILQDHFPSWTIAIDIRYPLGTSSAEADLARARLQYSQTQTQIRNLELQVATQVRDAGRQVSTSKKRVDATRLASQLAERRLDAEEKKFAAGTSTRFLVFQAQRDLTQARSHELRAILDQQRALVDFEAVQEAPLVSGGSAVAEAFVPGQW